MRAIKFLDFLASEEGQILNNWGIEGKQYEMENGKRVVPKEVQKRINQRQHGVHQRNRHRLLLPIMGAHYGDGAKDPTGNYYTKNFPEQIVERLQRRREGNAERVRRDDLEGPVPERRRVPVKAWGAAWNIAVPGEDDVTILGKQDEDITWKRIPEAVLAKPEDFDKIWDAYSRS